METWQVRVCPFEAKSDRTIRIHTGMKMGLWPWNPAFISLLLQRSMKGLKQLKWTRPTVAAAGTGCESQFFSEQSARAIQSLHFNLEPKPSLLLVYDVCQTRRRRKKKTRWRRRETCVNSVERAKPSAKLQHHLECSGTCGNNGWVNDPGRLPPSPGIRFSWEESVEPRDESRQPGIAATTGKARRGRLMRMRLNVEEASSWMPNTKSCGVINAMPLRLPSSGG